MTINNIRFCSPQELDVALKNTASNEGIDVRETTEFKLKKIPFTQSVPFSKLNENLNQIDKNKNHYLICTVGKRATQAAQILNGKGYKNIYVLDGGVKEWERSGFPVILGQGGVWDIERQVRLVAGFLVALGVGFGFAWHPAFFAVSAFVGLGLMISALTNTCTMGLILMKLPWNKSK